MADNEINKLLEGVCDVVMNADRPGAFLEALCDFADADAGSLWSNRDTTLSKEIFVLRSVHNRPEAEQLIGSTFFDLDDRDVVARKALIDKSPVIGTMGVRPFDKKWIEKPYTKDLRKLGVIQIALIPVFDLDDEPINVLSLYFRNRKVLDPDLLAGISALLTATSEAIDKRLRTLRLERRKDRHEVMAHTRIIGNKLESIRKSLDQNLSKSMPDRVTILKRYEDTVRSLNVLRKSYESSSFKERVSDRHNDTQYIDFPRQLQNILASTLSEFRTSGDVQAGNVLGGEKLNVLFHDEDFTMLFSNLYSNAVKYSTPGSVVRTEITRKRECVEVEIRNDIPIELKDDLAKIWNYEERGESVQASNIPGEGIGLGLVADICDVYEIDFEADYETSVSKKHTKVFCLRLKLPSGLVV